LIGRGCATAPPHLLSVRGRIFAYDRLRIPCCWCCVEHYPRVDDGRRAELSNIFAARYAIHLRVARGAGRAGRPLRVR
jgi:hypothetical protein